MNTLNRVWVTGDASVDLVPGTKDTYLKCPGGASANVAVCVARLGGNCGFIGCLGDDDAGHFLQQTLRQNGVDVSSLRIDPRQTTAVLIVNLAPNGERSFTYLVHPGAHTFVSVQDLPAFSPGEWFYFSSIGLSDSPAREACLEGARRMRATGGHVMFDVNLRISMWRDRQEIMPLCAEAISLASICKVSADELCWMGQVERWQDARDFIRDLGCGTVLITLGKAGALLLTPDGEYAFPAPDVHAVDTTGAGDAFVGGLLYTLSRQTSWDHSLLTEATVNANACGAMAVTAKGAMTALPYPDRLAAFRASHPQNENVKA